MAQSAQVNDPAFSWTGLEYLQSSAPTLEQARHNNIIVLENWATWCPPCRSSIPHLNSLHQRFNKQGVVFIGITNETDKNKLNQFIKSMGNKMTYPVAIDREDTMQQYNDKYSVRGIPHAFIIDHRGRVRWSGHPMSADFESTLERLTNELKQHKQQQHQQQQHQNIQQMSEQELQGKSVKELLQLVKEAGLSDQGCVEKSDLIARIQGKTTL